MIPAEAVEAAAKAMREVTPPPGVSKADWLAEHGDFALIAGAIAAAAPYMLAEVTALVAALTDPDDCHFDHHGGCQAHGYLDLKPGEMCPQLEAKAWAFNHRPAE